MDNKTKDGIKVGKYTLLLKPIGEGSYGTVFLAKDDKGNVYASKRVKLDKLKKTKVKEKFIREIKLLFKLDNPHILKMNDLLKSKTHIYVFLEYCNGETLNSFIENYKKIYNELIPPNIVQMFTKQIIEGLSYMSKKNCIHRDLKLENIMITTNISNDKENKNLQSIITNKDILNKVPLKQSIFSFNSFKGIIPTPKYFENKVNNLYDILKDYTIKIIDLGFAKQLEEETEKITSFCGSPLEMPPEIWSIYLGENKDYTKKCDLWSLGCVLYNLTFDSFPFNGESYEEIFHNIKKGKYIIKKINGLSIEFVDLICGLIKVDPEERYDYDVLINHPFIVKNYEDLKEFVFEDNSDHIILNANEPNKILDNIVINKENKLTSDECKNDEEKDKFIDNIFLNECEIIEYSIQDFDEDWVIVNLK